jgi:hypothetical protein
MRPLPSQPARPARVRCCIDAGREEPELSGQCGQSAHPSEAAEDILTQLERNGLVESAVALRAA